MLLYSAVRAALKIASVLVFCGLMMVFRSSSGFSKWASSRVNHIRDLDL